MEKEFEVEKILGKRSRNGVIKYKIRWKGYDETEDSWEPEENLTHCQELLDFYNLEKERDMSIIDQTISERFPHAARESSVLSSPKFTSTPAPNAVNNNVKKLKRPQRLLKEQDLRKSIIPSVKNKIEISEVNYTDRDDEPHSRWILLLFVVLVAILIMAVTPVGEFT